MKATGGAVLAAAFERESTKKTSSKTTGCRNRNEKKLMRLVQQREATKMGSPAETELPILIMTNKSYAARMCRNGDFSNLLRQ
jgi:hypothetical protein